jgi:N-acetylglucosaminyldiphosphoundecaprenol N-acetyl-beta-D-mannosaminyltransferase
VDATDYARATRQILDWAREQRSCYVCCACVNTIMEAHDSAAFAEVTNEAALVTADGMPLVWLLRRFGVADATRVYGPDLTLAVLAGAEDAGIPVGFYGVSQMVLDRLIARVRQRYPRLRIAYAEAPSFRPPTPEEDVRTVNRLRLSGARIVFVGLNTPKQDRWMHAHEGRVEAVMLGVGAAFDFIAGTKPQAPRWMQGSGLEWAFRLATEPRRLWRRYLYHNPRFVVLALAQLFRERRP